MEVRDPVHGNILLSDAEVAILDSGAYQRLRQIKQLGFSEFSFPGATHNRYLHSMGVCHLAGAAFDVIFANYHFSNSAVKKRFRQIGVDPFTVRRPFISGKFGIAIFALSR